MPTYQYRCAECGQDLEVVQKFSDAALTECPNCGGKLRKVYNAVGVVFKGSGFYSTDSRSSGNGSKSASSSESSSAGNGSASDSSSGSNGSSNGSSGGSSDSSSASSGNGSSGTSGSSSSAPAKAAAAG